VRALDLYTCFNMLIFDPDTTIESLETNIAFMRFAAEYPSNFGRVELYAGTPLLERMLAEGRCRGDYMQGDYALASEEVERVFRMAMGAFHARNFGPDALSNRIMGTRFDIEVARHFHPRLFSPAWLAEGKDLRLEIGEPVLVQGDSTRLHQVLLNLVQNALQHTPAAGGWVRLGVAEAGEHARATVQDNGPGIPAEHLAHVFDRFYLCPGSRGRRGIALVLSIVGHVAPQHGGAVTVENASDGGAVFTLRLPASVQARPDETPASGSGTGGLGDSRVTRRPEPLAELPEADVRQRDHARGQQRLTPRAVA